MKENQSGFTMIVDSILFCELYLLGKITYRLVRYFIVIQLAHKESY